MTEYVVTPEDIVSDFLRTRLTDPKDRAEDSETESVTATAGQTEIQLSASSGSVSCVTAVTVEGVTKYKWKDYFWDYQNQKVIFFTGLTKDDAVVVTYKYGTTNWIYSDKPDDNISAASFPRISVFTVSAPGSRLGRYDAPVESRTVLQIDVWCKDGVPYTIGDKTYSNEYLGRYLGGRITRAFEKNESDLFPVLYDYLPLSGPRTAPYSDEYQAYHTIVELSLKGLKSGRIEVN